MKKPAPASEPSEAPSKSNWWDEAETEGWNRAFGRPPKPAPALSESKYMDLDWHEQIELAAMDRSRHGGPPKAEILTPSEIEALRQRAKATSVFARKAFAHLRPKKV